MTEYELVSTLKYGDALVEDEIVAHACCWAEKRIAALEGGRLPTLEFFLSEQTYSKYISFALGKRNASVDWIKAIGIVTVVFIHSLPNAFLFDVHPVVAWCGDMTHFAVPGFLMCSGFLFAGAKAELAVVSKRLRRLLCPYLTFSVIAWCYQTAWSRDLQALDSVSFVVRVLLFDSLSIYYYVCLIVSLVILTPLICRIPNGLMPIAVIGALALELTSRIKLVPMSSLFWFVRNPARALGPFLLGWSLFQHQQISVTRNAPLRIRKECLRICVAVLGIAACAGGFALTQLSRGIWHSVIDWAMEYVILACIAGSTLEQEQAPYCARWLSDASYTIFLSHLFFLEPVQTAIPCPDGLLGCIQVLLSMAAGLSGSMSIVFAARKAFGAKLSSRYFG